MFRYHYKVENWFVYSCPGRVILLSHTSSREMTFILSFINLKYYSRRFGQMEIRRKMMICKNIIKRKKPSLKYITPILGGIICDRYKITSDITVSYENRGILIKDWEEKILVDVGFYK